MKRDIIIFVIAFAVGFVLADLLALHFAKTHNVSKYGGLFKRQAPYLRPVYNASKNQHSVFRR